jgi:hypothetical protein
MLGLSQFGPIVNIDQSRPPYENTRRLITSIDVGGDAGKAHGIVTPGKRSYRLNDGTFVHDPVWRYLYTHPVDQVGQPTPTDPTCVVDQEKMK